MPKKQSKLCSSGKAKKCEATCHACDAASPPACEDAKGAEWCAKFAKHPRRLSKLCSGAKANKCKSTCGAC